MGGYNSGDFSISDFIEFAMRNHVMAIIMLLFFALIYHWIHPDFFRDWYEALISEPCGRLWNWYKEKRKR